MTPDILRVVFSAGLAFGALLTVLCLVLLLHILDR
jgi:hypothetical protein